MVGKRRRWEIGIKIIYSTPSPASHLHVQQMLPHHKQEQSRAWKTTCIARCNVGAVNTRGQRPASQDPATLTSSSHLCKALLALSKYNIQNNQMFVVGPEPWPSLQDMFCKSRTKRQSLPQRMCNLKHQYPVVKAIK